jgi:hypothetical protein
MSVPNPNPGGAGDPNPNPNPGGAGGGQDPNDKVIKPEAYQRALDDMHAQKRRAAELEVKVGELSTQLSDLKKNDLKGKEDYKALWEASEAEKNALKTETTKLKQSVVLTEKFKAAQSALLQAGLKKEAMKILDRESFDEIVVEWTSEGRILTNGVETYVDKFKKEFPFAFQAAQPPQFNGGGGGSGPTGDEEITPAKIIALEQKMKARDAKQEDRDNYYGAVKKYQEQKKKKV